jgi:hypothetical protein
MWRIDRLPQAQVDMFEQELQKCAAGRGRSRAGGGQRRAGGEIMSASAVLARRFSDDPTSNGFLLIGRYERGLHNQLHRLMSRYEWLKKHRATMPIDEDEVRAERARRDDEIDAYVASCSARVKAEAEAREAERKHAREVAAKRTHSNPPQIPPAASEPAKCATNDPAPPTKRTHGATPADPVRPPPGM